MYQRPDAGCIFNKHPSHFLHGLSTLIDRMKDLSLSTYITLERGAPRELANLVGSLLYILKKPPIEGAAFTIRAERKELFRGCLLQRILCCC